MYINYKNEHLYDLSLENVIKRRYDGGCGADMTGNVCDTCMPPTTRIHPIAPQTSKGLITPHSLILHPQYSTG